VFDHDRIGLKKPFDGRRDLGIGKPVGPLEGPALPSPERSEGEGGPKGRMGTGLRAMAVDASEWAEERVGPRVMFPHHVSRSTRRARAMRHEPTEAERALWKRLRFRQINGLKFRRQVPVGPFIADFLCFEVRLILEVDGSQHAEDRADYDLRRTAYLERQGYRVLRFWNGDVLARPESVMEAIDAAIGR
jgi:very-short-patch-repair endonuclease